MPSYLASIGSLPLTPINSRVSRSVFVVRSGLITFHEWPRSVDLKTWLAQTKIVAGLCGEINIGVSQFQRYGFSPSGGSGRIVFLSLVNRSTRFIRPSCDSEYMMRSSLGSIWATKPSPPPMIHQSSFAIPPDERTALGPHQVLLSCNPPQTVYGDFIS